MTDGTNPTTLATRSSRFSRSTDGGYTLSADPSDIPPYGPPQPSGGSGSSSAIPTGPTFPRPSNATSAQASSAATTTAIDPSSSQCSSWIGVEVIYMVEVVEICPEGATVTTTTTQCVSTVTRSICETSTTNHPCYPCIMGTPFSSDHTVTVTRTSYAVETDTTVTLTIQPCQTCQTSTYVGTVPGYTPGAPCHGCQPYGPDPAGATTTSVGGGYPSGKPTPPGSPEPYGGGSNPAPPAPPGGNNPPAPYGGGSNPGPSPAPYGGNNPAPAPGGNPVPAPAPYGGNNPAPAPAPAPGSPHNPTGGVVPAPIPSASHTPYKPTATVPAITAGGAMNRVSWLLVLAAVFWV